MPVFESSGNRSLFYRVLHPNFFLLFASQLFACNLAILNCSAAFVENRIVRPRLRNAELFGQTFINEKSDRIFPHSEKHAKKVIKKRAVVRPGDPENHPGERKLKRYELFNPVCFCQPGAKAPRAVALPDIAKGYPAQTFSAAF